MSSCNIKPSTSTNLYKLIINHVVSLTKVNSNQILKSPGNLFEKLTIGMNKNTALGY
jgi:hypothetical protein